MFTTRLLWLGYHLDIWSICNYFIMEKKRYMRKMITLFMCLKTYPVAGVLITLTLKLLRVKLQPCVAYVCSYFGLIKPPPHPRYSGPVWSMAHPPCLCALACAHLWASLYGILPHPIQDALVFFSAMSISAPQPVMPFPFPHSFAWLNLMHPLGISLKVACPEKPFQKDTMIYSFDQSVKSSA